MKSRIWIRIGNTLTGLTVLFLLMDGVMKVAGASTSIETTRQLGFEPGTTRTLGLILIVATLLYALRQTSMLGAILVTAYLGGAIAVQLQHGAPMVTHVLFGVYVGIVMWVGLWLRLTHLQQIFPVIRRIDGK